VRTRILALTTAAALTAALTSCGGTEAGSDEPVTISFWNTYTASNRPTVEKIVDDFNASQSAVVVEMTIQPGDVQAQKLLPAYSAGEGPTIAAIDASQVPEFASLGVIQPVDDLYESGKLDASQLPEASLAATEYEGAQYGVPMMATPTMLYYNKSLFEQAGLSEPPSTMDELAEYAKQLTQYAPGAEATNVHGFAIADSAAPPVWAALLWSRGGGVVDGDPATFGDPATVEAMGYWNDLIQVDHISPVGLGGVEADALFAAGRAGMLINGPWASAGFTEAGVDYGVAPVPAGPAGQFTIAISSNMHLNAEATEEEAAAAYDFFAHWNSEEQQTTWATSTGFPPNLTTIDEAALAENPTSLAFSKAVGARFYLQGLQQAAAIDSGVVIPTIQRVTNGEGTPQELLPAAGAQIEELLSE